MLITVVISWSLQNFTVLIKTTEPLSEEETIQVYYKTTSQNGYNEKRSAILEKDGEYYKTKIKHIFFVGKEIRLDTNGCNEFEISEVVFKWNNIPLIKQELKTIQNNIVYTSGVELKGNKYIVSGEDPFIICRVLSGVQYIKYIFLLLLELIIIFFILFELMKLYKKDSEKCIKYVQVISIMLISIIILGYFSQAVKNINEQKEKTYFVNEEGTTYENVYDDCIESEFVAISDKLISLEFEIQNITKNNGIITYKIKKNKEDTKETNVKIEDVLSSDKKAIVLDVSKYNLKQGQKYILETRFTDCDMEIAEYNNQICIKQNYTFDYKMIYYVILIMILLFFVISLYCIMKYGLMNKTFVVLSLYIGVLAILIMPPASRDDEYRHFLRAYSLSEGKFVIQPSEPTGEEKGNFAFEDGKSYFLSVPKKINDLRLLDFDFNYNNRSYYAEVNQKLCINQLQIILKEKDVDNYSKVSLVATAGRGIIYYWPQTLLIWIGKLLKIDSAILFYLSRLGQLLICTIIGWLSLTLADKIRHIIWLVWFVPNIILLRSSCNTDGLLMALLILYMALIVCFEDKDVQLLNDKKGIVRSILLSILALYIVILKPPYLIYCIFLLILFRKKNFENIIYRVKNNQKKYFAIIGGGIVIIFGSAFLGKNIILNMLYKILPKEHIQYMLENPKSITTLFFDKWIQQIAEVFQSLNGSFVIPYALIIVISLLFIQKNCKIWKKIVLLVGFGAVVMGMVLVGYTLTPPDYGQIWGITYRYLLPAIPLIALALPCGNEKTQKYCVNLYPLYMCGMLTCTAITWLVQMWI